jgi:hypothetical protein
MAVRSKYGRRSGWFKIQLVDEEHLGQWVVGHDGSLP